MKIDRLWRLEPWVVWCLGAIAFCAVPIWLGSLGIGWDALNHHFYLGWEAEQPRFDRDFVAASFQSYQYPYLYWPAYRLAIGNASGVTAGVVLALLQSAAIPPVWIVAVRCCPGRNAVDLGFRTAAVALAFIGGLSLSLLDSTSNDMLATIPLLWSIACILIADEAYSANAGSGLRWVAASGVAAGIAVAFKLSNGPLAIVLPIGWAVVARTTKGRGIAVLVGGCAAILACIAVYAPWGIELWRHFGNPVYPFLDAWFEPMRRMAGWAR